MTKKVGLWFYTNENGYVIRNNIVRKLEDKGVSVIYDFDMRKCYCLNGTVYTENQVNLSELDVLFYMNMEERSQHQYDILKALELSGVRIENDFESYSTANDKFFSNMHLRGNGVKVAESMLIPTNISETILGKIFDDWKEIVVKPRDGVSAKGIMKFSNLESFVDFLSYAKGKEDNLYIERKINFIDRDIRVEVFDGKVVGNGFSRVMNHSFKTNVKAGGVATYIPADDASQQIAVNAAEAIGINATIVDMVRDLDDGLPCVLEVNPFLGVFYGEHYKSIGSNPPDYFCEQDELKVNLIVDYIGTIIGV